MKMKWVAVALVAMVAGSACLQASAGVVIGGTRVVYPSSKREVSVKLENKGGTPALIQAWLDDGDERALPNKVQVPFLLTPPIFRMESERSHSLRIMHAGESLPQDRESLYWLNVLEIPPKSEVAEGKNSLQFAFRNRIKMFYRPQGLPGSSLEAPTALQWKLVTDGGARLLEVSNPTPYYVSFATVGVLVDGKAIKKRDVGGGMVAPNAAERFAFDDGVLSNVREVSFTSINDYGALVEAKAMLTP